MDDHASATSQHRRMRIAIVGPAFPFRGGIAHFTNRLSQALSTEFDVRLLTFSRQYPSLLFPGKTQFESADWTLPATPERLIDSIGPRSWRRAGRWLAGEGVDAVVFCYWMPFFVPCYTGILKELRRATAREVPAILLLHNVAPHGHFPFAEPLLRKLLRQCDSFITLSASSTEELIDRKVDATVRTAFHPIYDMFAEQLSPELARQRLNLPDKHTLLFFGLIRRYKGLDTLIEAMPKILEAEDVQLLVAGEFYEDEEVIRNRVKELGIEKHVFFEATYIPNEKVHLCYSAADVVVQPYRSATQSGVTNIALHFSKPIIVTDVGGLAETVPDGVAGFVVPPEDPQALADAVIRFFECDSEVLINGARTQATKVSWERFADIFSRAVRQSTEETEP